MGALRMAPGGLGEDMTDRDKDGALFVALYLLETMAREYLRGLPIQN